MQVENDVHAILLDRVVCDLLEVLLLVARVVSSPRYLDPSCIRSWNTDEIHTTRRKLVDVLDGDVRRIAFLEHRVALVAKLDTAIPFIDSASTVLVPPVWVNGSFLSQPASKVNPIGMEVPPVDVVALASWSRGCKDCRNEAEEDGAESGLYDHDCGSRGCSR